MAAVHALLPAFLLLAQAVPVEPAPAPALDRSGDEAALATFAKLPEGDRKDLVDYFRLEASHLDTFQGSLLAYLLGRQDRDPSAWPEDGPAPWFDSAEHTPENDIPRHRLPQDAPQVARLRKEFFRGVPEPDLESAWRYDAGTGELRRGPAWKDAGRVFRNGLAGFAPDLDLAEALVERALDDGAQRTALAAFDHAYTDRDGGVYPGITLYDAWASGREIEMPDVDALGIVHTVLDDWTSWRAPVPAGRQEALYERIGGIYLPAHRHRSLRAALAACYLRGSPSLRDTWPAYLDNLHALWEDAASTPETLAPRLPRAADQQDFLAAWTRTCFERGDLFQAALRRRRVLDEDRARIRALLLRLLEEFAPSPTPSGAGADGGK